MFCQLVIDIDIDLDIDRCCDILTNTMADVIQKFTCLLKLRHKQTLQWINKDIYQLMKKLDHALKKITAHKIAYRGYETRL